MARHAKKVCWEAGESLRSGGFALPLHGYPHAGSRKDVEMMMRQVSDAVKTFFEEFERGSNTFFQSLGFQFVKIVPLDETQMDDHYRMVKVHAHMRFEKIQGQPIDVKDVSTYILFMRDDSPNIVFYTTHENVMTILQKSGVLPPKQETLSPDNSGTQ
jgi:hypothetical protein